MFSAGQTTVDDQVLAKGHGIIAERTDQDGTSVVLANLSGGNHGLSATVNARVVRDRVKALRVRVIGVKGLRDKDRNLLARVLFGSAMRETDPKKRRSKDRSLEWNQEVVFGGDDMGRSYNHTSSSSSQAARPIRLASVIPPFAEMPRASEHRATQPSLRSLSSLRSVVPPRVCTAFLPAVYSPGKSHCDTHVRYACVVLLLYLACSYADGTATSESDSMQLLLLRYAEKHNHNEHAITMSRCGSL